MPAGNVVIDGTFSQTPVASVNLAILNVGVNSTITPDSLTYEEKNYTAVIPHIFPTDPNQKFSIIAIPEDPQAELTITPDAQADGEYKLNEGKTEYTVTVSRTGASPDTNTYKFTIIYEPDITLKSIELSSSEDELGNWAHPISVQDEQPVAVPYSSVTITVSSNDPYIELEASKTGSGDLTASEATESGAKWTLTNIQSTPSTVRIKSSKNVGDKLYKKEYILNFVKAEDSEYPTSYRAASTGEGNGVNIIKDTDGNYYEVHTFITSGTLSFNSKPDEGLDAWVLVVGGGGGGCAGHRPGNGGGSGGVAEHTSYPLTADTYDIVVGAGGASVTSSAPSAPEGKDGQNSSFDNNAFVAYGGGGGGGHYYGGYHGREGGSSGGSGDGVAATATKGVVPNGGNVYGKEGAAAKRATDGGHADSNIQGGGGAGGPGSGSSGGPGITSSITGASVIYAAGGGSNVPAENGRQGTGNGGQQGGYGPPATSYAGGSGIVIVRFPAKPNTVNEAE
jgi:hypothetical protein